LVEEVMADLIAIRQVFIPRLAAQEEKAAALEEKVRRLEFAEDGDAPAVLLH
jgi:hypothetical protein